MLHTLHYTCVVKIVNIKMYVHKIFSSSHNQAEPQGEQEKSATKKHRSRNVQYSGKVSGVAIFMIVNFSSFNCRVTPCTHLRGYARQQ